MSRRATLLEKTEGEWSWDEIKAILRGTGAEVEKLPSNSTRIAVVSKLHASTIAEALGHTDYTSTEVDYEDRWK